MLRSDTIKAILAQTLPQMGCKGDAGETLAFSRMLEHVFTKVHEFKYPEGAGRRLVPVNYEVESGAETHTYRMTDDVGEADLIDSYADDLPLVDAYSTEHTGKVAGIGAGFFISIQDLRRAQMTGVNIDVRKATGARKMMERKLDKLMFNGDSKVAMTGFANSAAVAVETAVNGDWTNAATTNAEILADIDQLLAKIFDDTKSVYGNPDNGTKITLALPSAEYRALMGRNYSEFQVGKTLLQHIRELEQIEAVTTWQRLATADAAGTGPRMVGYVKDPDVIEAVIPQEFELMALQMRNLGYYTPCHMRFGGTIIRAPKAVCYMDGI